jgi:hypothetical protein
MLFPFQGKLGEIPTLCRNRKAGLPEEKYLYATPVAGVGRFFCTKSTFSCFGNCFRGEKVFCLLFEGGIRMRISRRKFGIMTGSALFGLACDQTPTGPTVIGAPPPVPSLLPTPPSTSTYGTLYRSGFAGTTGTLEYVLQMARIELEIERHPLGFFVVKLGGREAPPARYPDGRIIVDANGRPRRGYYFTVNDHQISSITHGPLAIRDEWKAYDWNGREFWNA